jgi:DeoR/GlpR family transcriptional regulator of sugar metabolism
MTPLLNVERRAYLLAQLDRDGAIRLDPIANELGVSVMTVRRDLLDLEAEGLVRRVRGGAVPAMLPQPFSERMARRGAIKTAIARKAEDLIPSSGAVAFDASSTAAALIDLIDGGDGLVVATNSLENAAAARRRPGVRAILIGGDLDERTGSFVGPIAARAAEGLAYRRFFMSASAIDPDFGTSEVSLAEAQVKIDIARVAGEVVLLADSSKLGERAVGRGIDWRDIDVLVTELDPEDVRLAAYRELVELR